MLHYEAGGEVPENNTLPALFSLLINQNSGNGWFWKSDVPTATLLSVDKLVNQTLHVLEPQWVTFVLNTPPNTAGQLDNNIVTRLGEVGQAWEPDTTRDPLPDQQPQVEYPITPYSAEATSGNASKAIDGLNDRYYYSYWETSTSFPESITIYLGAEYPDVNILSYVPKYIPYIDPQEEGSSQNYKVYVLRIILYKHIRKIS